MCHSQCKKKKWQKGGMQNRFRSLSSGAVLAVHSCSYSGRKLNNLLQMQCFNHKLLFRKECLTTPQNARQKDPMVISTAFFIHWTAYLSVNFIAVSVTKSQHTKIMCLNISVSCDQCLSHNAVVNYVKNTNRMFNTYCRGRATKVDVGHTLWHTNL